MCRADDDAKYTWYSILLEVLKSKNRMIMQKNNPSMRGYFLGGYFLSEDFLLVLSAIS